MTRGARGCLGAPLAFGVAVLLVAALAGCSGGTDAGGEPDAAAGADTGADAGAGTGAGTGADPAEQATPESADCSPARPTDLVPGEPTRRGLTIDGTERTYTIAVPLIYDGRTALALVLNFHGWGSSAEQQESNTSLSERGVRRDVVVVTPDATGSPAEWNMFDDPAGTPDFDHVGTLVDMLLDTHCLDADRVFAVGHSNGAAFTGFLACREPFRFAAVAMVAATIPSTCPEGRTPSVLAISGDSDPQVPYAGGAVGGGPTKIPGAVETMAGYLRRYGCSAAVSVTEPIPGVRSERSSQCTSGAVVGFDTVAGGTHPWPGGEAAAADPTNSEAGRTYDATGAVLEFFDAAPPRDS